VTTKQKQKRRAEQMLKRVLRVADLLAEGKSQPEPTPQKPPKTQS
jgi:hypothetical protein